VPLSEDMMTSIRHRAVVLLAFLSPATLALWGGGACGREGGGAHALNSALSQMPAPL